MVFILLFLSVEQAILFTLNYTSERRTSISVSIERWI